MKWVSNYGNAAGDFTEGNGGNEEEGVASVTDVPAPSRKSNLALTLSSEQNNYSD